MHRFVALSLIALALSACQKTVDEMTWPEKKQLAQEIMARCEKEGEKPGTAAFDECGITYADQEIARRVNNRRQLAMTLRAVGSGLEAYGSQQPKFSKTTICQPWGTGVMCNEN